MVDIDVHEDVTNFCYIPYHIEYQQ